MTESLPHREWVLNLTTKFDPKMSILTMAIG